MDGDRDTQIWIGHKRTGTGMQMNTDMDRDTNMDMDNYNGQRTKKRFIKFKKFYKIEF